MGSYRMPAQSRLALHCLEERMIGGRRFVCICDHTAGQGVTPSGHYMVAAARVPLPRGAGRESS